MRKITHCLMHDLDYSEIVILKVGTHIRMDRDPPTLGDNVPSLKGFLLMDSLRYVDALMQMA
jgi:hypothetical protein